MARQLDTATLDAAAQHYAGEWLRADRKSPSGKFFVGGKSYVLQDFYNFDFKDEFEYMLERIKGELSTRNLAGFESAAGELFEPRSDKTFAGLLKQKLAIDPDGNHIEGAIGTTDLGRIRVVERYAKLVRLPVSGRETFVAKARTWPIYAGEVEERIAERIRSEIGVGPGADPLPEGTEPLPVGANVTNISAEACIAALDAATARVAEGSTAGEIRGRSGAQPADPDAAETGTLGFTLPMNATEFAAAVDDTDGSCSATANAITDDSSADATITLGWCRTAATGTGADDHIDGNAGTVDETFVFNTVSIVSGSTVSMTSYVLGMSQGSTAS